MKNTILIFLMLAGLTWTACEKSSDTQETNELIGTWDLIKVTGGFSGAGYPAKFDALRIKTSEFELLKAKSSIYTGAYTLKPTTGTPDSFKISSSVQPIIDGFSNYDKTISLSKDNLVLSDPCCDLYTYEFTRTKD